MNLEDNKMQVKKPSVSNQDALLAVKTLLRWIGEDPDREGLVDTPKRVLKSYLEHFSGYAQDPMAVLDKKFTETSGYNEMIILKDIDMQSYCEHHMAPILGKVHIAYYPQKHILGISKLVRIVEIYAKRLQIQERLTMQIANALNIGLKPKGVAVQIEATHHCMCNRGVKNKSAKMITRSFLGCLDDQGKREQFIHNIS